MNDDLEHTLRDALEQRGAGATSPLTSGNIDDVYNRVDRRRDRRRSVAVLGSVAIIALGAVGLAMVDRGDPPAASYEGALPGDSIPATTYIVAAPGTNVWACIGQLGYDETGAALYSSCVPTTYAPYDDGVAATGCYTPTTTTMPPTTTAAPGGDVPATTIEYLIDDGCMVAPPTLAPLATTTTIYFGDGSSPPQFIDCRPAVDPAVDPVADTTTTTMPPTTTAVIPPPYIVVVGDSIFSIAEQYGVDPAILANFNSWSDCLNHVILVGDIIQIPPA